ncbi:hypothetical protein EJ06DRAFT_352384 [Trichodelitschia bisporula]|uniref:RWD domain-containing protein n=1 Tax=Trichodelitschia bisporula TaxID=703511 RepID=A0A6G1HZX6_9PEZI|nr:hypothetical protein EJ06DRAFT_352384 [Trichodelitschia bisporula]
MALPHAEHQACADEFADELALLEAMFPEEIVYDSKRSEISYRAEDGTLQLRIPPEYPRAARPEVITASGPAKQDLRDHLLYRIAIMEVGEPVLDAVISAFLDIITAEREAEGQSQETEVSTREPDGRKTVIIWLHHLLATSKRKHALAPEGDAATSVSGVTKPGYPGVMLFSGPAHAVDSHVHALKRLRWQAFQVRHEANQEWKFKHGQSIIEVETISEVVGAVEDEANGKREIILAALRIK